MAIDEQVSLVEPDEIPADDGQARSFAKAFIYDETPRMRVINEVYDLMRLADPLVGALFEDSSVEDFVVEFGDDGLEALWAAGSEAIESEAAGEVAYEVSEEACAGFAALMATGTGFEAQPDWSAVGLMAVASEDVEDVLFGDDGFDIPEDCAAGSFWAMEPVEVPVPYAPAAEALAGGTVPAPAVGPATVVPASAGKAMAIAAPSEKLKAIPAPSEIRAIPAPVSVPALAQATLVPALCADSVCEAGESAVVFTFGPQNAPERSWRVCFSFRGRLRKPSSHIHECPGAPSPGAILRNLLC